MPFSLNIFAIFCRAVSNVVFIMVEYPVNSFMKNYITIMTKVSEF